jgi:hypothetical protein
MGELIYLRASSDAGRSRSSSPDGKGATILLFTGVRYQRHEQPDLLGSELGSDFPPKGGMDGAGRGKRKRRG